MPHSLSRRRLALPRVIPWRIAAFADAAAASEDGARQEAAELFEQTIERATE
jgi:hypothetical protein